MKEKQQQQPPVATSKARVEAKTIGIATLGPVRIFSRKEDPQPLRRKPNTLIENIFPTVRFRRDLAEREDALNAQIAEMKKDLQGYMAEMEARYASAKAAENELWKKVVELEGTVQDKERIMKTHDSILETRNAQLKQKEQQLNEQRKGFAKTVSSITHDMKSPLTNIKGFAGVLGEEELDDANKIMVNQIYRGAMVLESMVEDILLYNKLEHSAVKLKKETYSLTEQISQLMEGNRKYASHERRNMALVFDAGADVQIYGDRARLERVFGNLLSNAIKYGNSKVVVSITSTANSINVSISDDGKDMDKEVRDKIFKGQEMVTTDLINGNGFGLTNSKKIIDMHGGSIHFESDDGKGKTFIVEIPIR